MRRMFLNGTAMSGQKDHHAIAGASFVGPARTAARYRFFAVRDEFPGLFPVDEHGCSIVGELYEVTEDILFRSLLPEEPAELEKFIRAFPSSMARDLDDAPVFLAASAWSLNYEKEKWPLIVFSDVKDYQKKAS